MNDTTCPTKKQDEQTSVGPDIRLIQINSKTIKLLEFGDIAVSPHGISTGDNKKYVRVNKGIKEVIPKLRTG